jgi:hypothetical protein
MDEGGFEIQESSDEWGFMRARDGDHLVTLIQCDLCHFRNLMERDPMYDLSQDVQRVLKLIRMVNLDAIWTREPSMVCGTLVTCWKGADIAASLGFLKQAVLTNETIP